MREEKAPNLKTGDGELFKVPKTGCVDAAGRKVPKGTPGAVEQVTYSRKRYIRLRQPDGKWKKFPLSSFKDVAADEAAKLRRKLERQAAGLVDANEDAPTAPLKQHVDAYLRYLSAEQRDPVYIQQTRREIAKAAKWCKHGSLDGLDFLDDPEAVAKADALLAKMTLADLRVDRLNAFMASSASGRAKTTKNRYRRSLYGMCEHANLRPNPIADVKRLTVKPKDLTRLRRAPPPDMLQRLVDVAQNRPLREAALIRRGPRKGQVGNLSPGYLAKLARGARPRALVYLTAALTGLRYGALCRVKVAFVDLTPGREAGDLPAGILNGGRDYRAPIRADLVRVRSRTTTRPCTSCSAGSGTT
jgi:hypothetical protein